MSLQGATSILLSRRDRRSSWARMLTATLAAVSTAAVLSACGGSSTPEAGVATTSTPKADVIATLGDFSIRLEPSILKAGRVTIDTRNTGKINHELVVFRSDLDEAALPLLSDGTRIDEEGKGITHLDPEAEDVTPGTSRVISIDLKAGRYVVVCNLPAHYRQGMVAVLTVT